MRDGKRKRIDYVELVRRAKQDVKRVKALALDLNGYELTENVHKELDDSSQKSDEVLEDCKGGDKNTFAQISENCAHIQDCVGEIILLTGDIIKRANDLPEVQRKSWYKFVGQQAIEKSDAGMSDELLAKVAEMQEIMDAFDDHSSEYYSLKREDYVDFEDEIGEDET